MKPAAAPLPVKLVGDGNRVAECDCWACAAIRKARAAVAKLDAPATAGTGEQGGGDGQR